MVGAFPLLIFLGSAAVVALLFYALWDVIQRRAIGRVQRLAATIDRAGIRRPADQWVLEWASGTAIVWVCAVFLFHAKFVFGCVLLPICAAVCAAGVFASIRIRLSRRIAAFTGQLELALRLMSSALRVGLGLRQAIALAVDEMPEPSKSEYMRIIGQINIGVSIYDALDDLAERMTGNETRMLARVVRIQSQTGGDLSKILEQLANSIKERRRMKRKISALTAEGRASCFVLVGIPIALALVICLVQPPMGRALFLTNAGHVTLAIAAVLEVCAAVSLNRIMKVDFV